MKRSMFVTVGFKQDSLRSASIDVNALLTEAKAFQYAVGMMLNTVVAPVDFNVAITSTNNGFHVEISTPDHMDDARFASTMFEHDKSVKSEDDMKQKLWDLLGSYLEHVDDMINTYGVYFGDNLMFIAN